MAVLFSMVLIAGACGGSTTLDEPVEAASAPSTNTNTQDDAEAPTAAPAPEPTAAPEPDPTPAPEPTATPEPEPQFWSDVLEVGDCIIRPELGTLPTPQPCEEPHEEEIYAIAALEMGPDEPYPGDDAMGDLVSEALCDEATPAFGGEVFADLPFNTYLLYPLQDEWEAGDRGIMCSAGPPEGTSLKIGTAAGGTLDSDDVLLARGAFASDGVDFQDWAVVTEGSTLEQVGTLTNREFALPRRRAFPVTQGFIFSAPDPDEDGFATSSYGYGWASGEITPLGSILPGWEIASLAVLGDATMFAARETRDDDWDLYVGNNADGVEPLADGPGDQQYPTFVPDASAVVFHDDGVLSMVNIDGTDRRPLVDPVAGASDYESAVSPDGTLIAFASNRSGNDDIWLVGIEGGEPINLTAHPADEAWPTWSLDGERIYFQTDRLRIENEVSSIMMMNADGSNASWFSGVSAGQVMAVDPAVAADVVATAPTLDERYNYELIEGEPGTTTAWQHSSGRLSLELPAGWRVGELEGEIGLLAAPRPSLYFETWSADAVAVTLYDGDSRDDFFARVDTTAAVEQCDPFDGSGEILSVEGQPDLYSINLNCGDGSVGGVLAFYNTETLVGVIVEGQRDNLPDADLDSDTLTAIAISLIWQ